MTRRENRTSVYRLSLSALLLAMMLILGFVESLIPSPGVPGIKLGLSNGVLIFAVYMLDIPTAYVLMSMKVVLSGVMFSGPSTMMYGFAGGLLSLTCMALLSRVKKLPVPAVSVVGGVMHNAGQIGLSLLILQVPPMSMLVYLLVLAGVGAACGLLTGVCAKSVMQHLRRIPGMKRNGRKQKRQLMTWLVVIAVVAAAGVYAWSRMQRTADPVADKPVVTISSEVTPMPGMPVIPR